MAERMNVLTARQHMFVFLLLPEFTMLAFSSAIEMLRMANAALGREAYLWRLVTCETREVRASCGVTVLGDCILAEERSAINRANRSQVVVVCGGLNVQRHSNGRIEAWLRECRQNGMTIASLCTGAHVLAQAGLLEGRKCVIHWEDYPSFAEKFHTASVHSALFEIDGDIITCAGGTASLDMMLHLIRRDHGDKIVEAVCGRAIVDRIRGPRDRQRLLLSLQTSQHHQAVLNLIERMHESLSDPVPVDELMAGLGLTRRQIERLFQSKLHISPARYYMNLRLDRARLLLQQTSKPIVEIALANGFSSASHFSKAYRDAYGSSPHEMRKRGGSA